MSTDTIKSPFVAKAHFYDEKKWLGRYQTFWFQSQNLTKKDSPISQHWTSLKSYVEKAVINNTHELIIFDNRTNYVNNGQKSGVNIVCQYVNGQLIKDHSYNLSFLEWTFSPLFCNNLANSFTTSKHKINDEIYLESESIRENNFLMEWDSIVKNYKRSQEQMNLLKQSL